MYLMSTEARDEVERIEFDAESRLRAAVIGTDIHHGLKSYKALFEDQGEDGFTPTTPADFKQMMREMAWAEVAGEL